MVENILWDMLKELFNIILDLDSFKVPAVALEGHAITPNEELFEVPGDVIPAHWRPDDVLWVGHQRHWIIMRKRECLFQESEEWVSICPIHITLLKYGEVGLITIARADML